jgi:hypothetical protein
MTNISQHKAKSRFLMDYFDDHISTHVRLAGKAYVIAGRLSRERQGSQPAALHLPPRAEELRTVMDPNQIPPARCASSAQRVDGESIAKEDVQDRRGEVAFEYIWPALDSNTRHVPYRASPTEMPARALWKDTKESAPPILAAPAITPSTFAGSVEIPSIGMLWAPAVRATPSRRPQMHRRVRPFMPYNRKKRFDTQEPRARRPRVREACARLSQMSRESQRSATGHRA